MTKGKARSHNYLEMQSSRSEQIALTGTDGWNMVGHHPSTATYIFFFSIKRFKADYRSDSFLCLEDEVMLL